MYETQGPALGTTQTIETSKHRDSHKASEMRQTRRSRPAWVWGGARSILKLQPRCCCRLPVLTPRCHDIGGRKPLQLCCYCRLVATLREDPAVGVCQESSLHRAQVVFYISNLSTAGQEDTQPHSTFIFRPLGSIAKSTFTSPEESHCRLHQFAR